MSSMFHVTYLSSTFHIVLPSSILHIIMERRYISLTVVHKYLDITFLYIYILFTLSPFASLVSTCRALYFTAHYSINLDFHYCNVYWKQAWEKCFPCHAWEQYVPLIDSEIQNLMYFFDRSQASLPAGLHHEFWNSCRNSSNHRFGSFFMRVDPVHWQRALVAVNLVKFWNQFGENIVS